MDRSTAGRGDWLTTVAVGLAALVPRLYVAVAWAREPVWDGHYYDFGAQRIAAGLGYSNDLVMGGQVVWHPWCHYPVGYSGFLAALYTLFGDGGLVAPVANAVLGMLIVMLTHRIALHMLSARRARLAAVLCAASPELVFYSPLVMTELLATFLPLLAGFTVLLHGARARLRGAALAGGIMGLATLVRPQSLLFVPVLGLMLMRTGWRRDAFRAAGLAAVASVVALLVVAPWTYRNCRVMDGCALVSTNGGWNLAIGALERATGRFETLRAADGCRVVTGQVQQDRCWAQQGLAAIARDPARWLGLAPKKLGHCFDHASFPVEYLREANPAAWPEARRLWWREFLTFLHRLLLSGAG
ncbi:MAG: glycosyltransferase family 39 protein [Polyangiaceae bacterium]|nr:glycosyltransferase family 39 protein [Polyangiaceae bacterium]